MNEIPKVVFSGTLKVASWDQSMIARETSQTKSRSCGSARWGDHCLGRSKVSLSRYPRAGLIDEYAVITRPVAYGGGESLFRDLGETLELDVLSTTAYTGGTALHLYEPRR